MSRALSLEVESRQRSRLLFEHDLFGKPVPTFPDHALAPSERDLAQGHFAEALRALGDRLAAKAQVKGARRIVIGERPHQEAPEPLLGKPGARALEQLLAKAEALIDGMQIELE